MSPHNLFAATLFAVTALAALSASPVRADVKDRLYDFTDATYRQNGIDPAKLGGRKQAGAPAALPAAVKETPNFSWAEMVGTSSAGKALSTR